MRCCHVVLLRLLPYFLHGCLVLPALVPPFVLPQVPLPGSNSVHGARFATAAMLLLRPLVRIIPPLLRLRVLLSLLLLRLLLLQPLAPLLLWVVLSMLPLLLSPLKSMVVVPCMLSQHWLWASPTLGPLLWDNASIRIAINVGRFTVWRTRACAQNSVSRAAPQTCPQARCLNEGVCLWARLSATICCGGVACMHW